VGLFSQDKIALSPQIEKMRAQVVVILASVYLRGEPQYLDAETRALKKFYSDHVRLVYGGGAKNNVELFLPSVTPEGRRTWDIRPSHQELVSNSRLMEALRSSPGVDLIFIRKSNDEIGTAPKLSGYMEISVFDRMGSEGLITVKRDTDSRELLYQYESKSANDPIRYMGSGPGEDRFRNYNEWNDLSVIRNHYYHNVVAGMGSYLYSKNPAIGDVTLMHSQGWSFGDNAGGAGGVHAEEKRTVMLFSGPGVKTGELKSRARYQTSGSQRKDQVHVKNSSHETYPTVVDSIPTILNWLGYGDRALSQFAADPTQTGFQQHLKQWVGGQQTLYFEDFIQELNERVKKVTPQSSFDADKYRLFLKRFFRFMLHQKPAELNGDFPLEDGNQLILDSEVSKN